MSLNVTGIFNPLVHCENVMHVNTRTDTISYDKDILSLKLYINCVVTVQNLTNMDAKIILKLE